MQLTVAGAVEHTQLCSEDSYVHWISRPDSKDPGSIQVICRNHASVPTMTAGFDLESADGQAGWEGTLERASGSLSGDGRYCDDDVTAEVGACFTVGDYPYSSEDIKLAAAWETAVRDAHCTVDISSTPWDRGRIECEDMGVFDTDYDLDDLGSIDLLLEWERDAWPDWSTSDRIVPPVATE